MRRYSYRALSMILIGVGCGPAPGASEGTSLKPPARGKIPVAIVLTENANLIDFAGPWEVFANVRVPARSDSAANSPENARYPFRLFTVSDERKPISISVGLTVTPDYTFADAPVPRIVVVGAQGGSPGMKAWLQKTARQKETEVMMSVCTGAFRLAAAGLLDGKPATTHHGHYDDFAAAFPKVQVRRGVRFVRSDERILTAGGLTSGIDLALHVVALYFGQGTAQQTAEWLEHSGSPWRGNRD